MFDGIQYNFFFGEKAPKTISVSVRVYVFPIEKKAIRWNLLLKYLCFCDGNISIVKNKYFGWSAVWCAVKRVNVIQHDSQKPPFPCSPENTKKKKVSVFKIFFKTVNFLLCILFTGFSFFFLQIFLCMGFIMFWPVITRHSTNSGSGCVAGRKPTETIEEVLTLAFIGTRSFIVHFWRSAQVAHTGARKLRFTFVVRTRRKLFWWPAHKSDSCVDNWC